MAKEIEYALVDMDGDPATWVHQDDTEIPLVASSLYRLLDQVGDWCDCGLEYVLDNLDGEIISSEPLIPTRARSHTYSLPIRITMVRDTRSCAMLSQRKT